MNVNGSISDAELLLRCRTPNQMQNSYSVVRIGSQMECSGSQLVGMIVFVRNPKHCSLTPSHPCPTPSSLKLSGDVLQCYAGGEIFHTLQHRLRSVNRFKPFLSRGQQKLTTPRSHNYRNYAAEHNLAKSINNLPK